VCVVCVLYSGGKRAGSDQPGPSSQARVRVARSVGRWDHRHHHHRHHHCVYNGQQTEPVSSADQLRHARDMDAIACAFTLYLIKICLFCNFCYNLRRLGVK